MFQTSSKPEGHVQMEGQRTCNSCSILSLAETQYSSYLWAELKKHRWSVSLQGFTMSNYCTLTNPAIITHLFERHFSSTSTALSFTHCSHIPSAIKQVHNMKRNLSTQNTDKSPSQGTPAAWNNTVEDSPYWRHWPREQQNCTGRTKNQKSTKPTYKQFKNAVTPRQIDLQTLILLN